MGIFQTLKFWNGIYLKIRKNLPVNNFEPYSKFPNSKLTERTLSRQAAQLGKESIP